MYIKYNNDNFVKATVYPFAKPDDDPRFIGSSPSVAVMPDGDILYNGKAVTVESVVADAAALILAVIEAEKIAGKEDNRNTLAVLAQLLQREIGE